MRPISFGPYLMLERLAIGGMAEVWLARQKTSSGTDKVVALKRILPTISEDQEFITMFTDEARIAGQLAHANIAQIFDVGKIGQSYYIALEYVAGPDLRVLWDRVRGRGGFPLSVACHIVAKMCEGLDYAHRRKDNRGKPMGIIHRDVSPQNVLVSYDGDVKIIDFGIAKASDRAARTQTGILKGKFAYMAPEHARGMPMDHRADIFAIGVILHELITGERLFRADSDFSLLEKVRNAEVDTPRHARPDTPPELEKIVMRALAARPEDRYPWASAMQADLERFLVASRRSCSREDLARFVQDHFTEQHRTEQQRQKEAMRASARGDDDASIIARAPGADGTNVVDAPEEAYQTREMDEQSEEHTAIHEDATHDAAGLEGGHTLAGIPPPADEDFSDPGTRDARRGKRSRGGGGISDPTQDAALLAAVAGETLAGDGATDPSREEERPPPRKQIRLEEDDLDNELVPQARPRPREPSARLPRLEDLPTADAPGKRAEASSFASTTEKSVGRGRLPQSMAEVAGPDSDPSQVSRRQAAHLQARGHNSGELSIHSSATAPGDRVPGRGLPWPIIGGAAAGGLLLGMLLILALQQTRVLGKGTLVVLTGREQAKILVDEQPVPGSAYAVERVGAGQHKVTIMLEGYQPDIQQVHVPPNGIATVQMAVRNARGSLHITSVPPGATVLINDQKRPGTTPMTVEDLDPGVTYQVTLRHPDTLPDTSEARTMAGETFKIVRKLKQHVSRVAVEPIPDDAAVSVDGLFKGRGKGTVKTLKMGQKASVKVFRPGCETQSFDVTAAGEDILQKVELKCGDMDAAVTLLSPSGARLRIDDLDTGLELPVRNYKLPAGRHTFELVGRRVQRWVEGLNPGHTTLRPD